MADQKVNKVEFSLGSLAIPGTIGDESYTAVAFNATQAAAGTVASDRYSRFLKDFPPLSVTDPAEQRGARAITVMHHVALARTSGSPTAATIVAFDWIQTSGGAATATLVDPVTGTRHMRLRATIKRAYAVASYARTTLAGTCYAQRQHSIEV